MQLWVNTFIEVEVNKHSMFDGALLHVTQTKIWLML